MKYIAGVFLSLAVLVAGVSRTGWWEISRGISHCKNQPDIAAEVCYSALLNNVFAHHGLSIALNAVQKISAADERFPHYCHNDMHELGHAAYATYEKDGAITLSPGFSYCGYGFYHGFMEEMFAQTGSVAGALAFCKSLGNESDVSNCFHGIGHGVVDGLDPRAWGDPFAMAAPGLALCRDVAPSAGGLERSCAMGVFNSIELMVPDPRYKLSTLEKEPFGWCNNGSFTPDEKRACDTEMSVLTMDVTHQNYDRAFAYVAAIDPAYQAWTVRYLALFSFSGATVPRAADVIGACKRVVGKYLDDCIEGFTQGLIVYGGADNKYAAAIRFCQDPMLTVSQAELCAHTIIYSDAPTKASQKKMCGYFPKDFTPHECTGNAID